MSRDQWVWTSGIRNCVDEAVNLDTGELGCSTNERDGRGDHLMPDYLTSTPQDSFFGRPWRYMGGPQDPRLPGTHPELPSKVRTPDVLLRPHFASLEMLFYPEHAVAFPESDDGDVFAAEHGSRKKSKRAGCEAIYAQGRNGEATGEFGDVLTSFVTADGQVWGRPAGVTVAKDRGLLVPDDGSNTVWRVGTVGNGVARGR